MVTRILFVCLGNICRSPAAEAVLAARVAQLGLDVQVDSCGTGPWHVGEGPHPPMVAAAARRGLAMAHLRARQITADDFHRFDRIIVMDRSNLRDVAQIAPAGGVRPELLLSHAPDCREKDVPDPWYTGEFDRVLDLIEAGVDGLIRQL